jgi:predicted secreted protein
MAASAGKNLRVKVSPTVGGAGTYTLVAGAKNATMTQNGQTLDVSAFGAAAVEKILGLRDATYSLSGNYEGGDTNGQVAIRSALADTTLWIQFLPDGTTGFKQEVKVASFDITAAVDGIVEFTANLEGSGAIAAV